MGPIKSRILRIVQNVVRMVGTMAPIAVPIGFMYSQGTDVLAIINGLPIWAQITIGAVMGGLLFTPANNIGNLFWEMVTVLVRRAIDAPEPGEKPYSQKTLAFAKRKRELRKASLWRVLFELSRSAAIPVLIPTVGIGGLVAVAAVVGVMVGEVKLRPETSLVIIGVLLGLFVLYIVLLLAAVVPMALAIKLYFHDGNT